LMTLETFIFELHLLTV
jgi:hypothetical protein